MSDDDDKEDGIYKVDTVPPPAGESDAYNAPTRVGPMAAAVVEEMMHAAEKKAAELSQRAEAKRAEPSTRSPDSAGKAEAKRPPLGTTSPPASKPPIASSAPKSTPGAAVTSPPPSAGKYSVVSADVRAPSLAPQRMYEEDDDEENAATLLSRAAKAPVVAPLPPRPFRAPPAPDAKASDRDLSAPAPRPPVVSFDQTAPLGPQEGAAPRSAISSAPIASGTSSPPSALVASPFEIVAPQSQAPAPSHASDARFASWIPLAVGVSIFIAGALLYVFMAR